MDISRAGWAVAGHAGTAGNVIEEAHRVRKLPPPRILVQCADYMAATNLVAHTDLLCMIPHPALLQICQGMGIAPLRIREGLPRYEVCLFWRPAQPEDGAASVKAVIAALTGLAPQD